MKSTNADFHFPDNHELAVPLDIETLLAEYDDGRRNFNHVDLRNGDLTRAKLPMISLEESILQQANLSSANLAGGTLNHADFSNATLTNANFIAADLVRAKLIGANLAGAVMSGANLSGASLRKADLTNCIFVGANLTGVDFSGAVLKNTAFGGANLKGANLSEVDLSQVELTNLDLTEALLPEGLAGECWSHNNRDLRVSFNQTVPSWDSPMETSIPDPGADPDRAMAEQTNPFPQAMIPEETGRYLAQDNGDARALVPVELPAAPLPLEDTAIVPLKVMDREPLEDTEWVGPNQAASVEPPTVAADAITPPEQRARPIPPTPLSRANQPLNSRVVQSIQAVLGRRVQYSLQRKMLDLYHHRCAISACDIQPLLETVFIVSPDRDEVDHPSQCLVLRADLKTLYDLKLLAIHPQELTVLIAPQLLESDYGRFQGHPITIPDQKIYHPSPKGLAQHLQDCTWYDDRDHPPAQLGIVAPVAPLSGRSSHPWFGQPTLAALGIGVIAGLGLGWPLHQILSARPDSEPADAVVQVSPPLSNSIHIQVGDLRYRQQGVILDEKAYIALDQAQQLGLPTDDVPGAYQRQYQGQTYLQLSHLATLGVPVGWDAQMRTAILDCCQAMDLERVALTINDRTWPEAGLIVDHRAYVPRQHLADLALDLDRLNPAHSIDYENETYVRASALKDLAATVQWDAETRVLSLHR